MAISFYASDMHFSHKRIIEFGRPFASVEEHDEEIVKRWNAKVGPRDEVLILGDVSFNSGLRHISRLNGFKILVPGNHDHKSIDDYILEFDEIKGYEQNRNLGILFSHIPVHPSCLERWKHNVHGHTHFHHVMRDNKYPLYADMQVRDTRYVNISMEQTDYAPLSHDELVMRLK